MLYIRQDTDAAQAAIVRFPTQDFTWFHFFFSNNFEDEVGNDEQKSMDEGKRKTTPCQSIN